MGELKYPVRKHADAPDWDDLTYDFTWPGAGLLFWGLSVEGVILRARGRRAIMVVPYAELTTGRASVGEEAAIWREQFFPDLVVSCPAADAEAAICSGRVSVNPADSAATWLDMTRMHMNAAEVAIIPPIEGWGRSLEVFQIAEAFLSAARPVYVIGGRRDERT